MYPCARKLCEVCIFFTLSSFAIKQDDQTGKKSSYCTLYVPIHHSLLFLSEALEGRAAGWGSQGAPDTVVNMLSSGLYHLQLLCSAASVMQSKHGSSQVFISLTAEFGPGLTSLHTSVPQHICSNGSCRAKTLCHFLSFFFIYYNTRCGKLVGLEHPEGGGCVYHLS